MKKRGVLVLLVTLPALASAAPALHNITKKGHADVRFTLDAPLDSIVGVTDAVSGSAHFDPETGAISGGRFTVDLGTFRTGISLRDEDLREEFFEVSKFPNAILEVQRIERKSEGKPPLGQIEQGTAVATLLLHGVDRPVRIPVQFQAVQAGGRSVLHLKGAFKLILSEYNIKRPKVLFLKLGEVARVDVQATLIGPAPATTPPEAKDAELSALLSPLIEKRGGPIVVAQLRPQKAEVKKSKFHFPSDSLAGRGEHLLYDPKVGGAGNALTCATCHGVADERLGIEDQGLIRPNRTLFDSAKRPTLWQGIEPTPGKAASLCVRLFMFNQAGLSAKQEAEFDAYAKANSPDDAVPPLDYRVLALTRKTGLLRPTAGERALGAKLEKRFCGGCHGAGLIRPPLTPGLYEPDYLVTRVRWMPGHDARQMPPIYMDRLPDSELRHIVTYLAGDESKRIFARKRHAAAAAAK